MFSFQLLTAMAVKEHSGLTQRSVTLHGAPGKRYYLTAVPQPHNLEAFHSGFQSARMSKIFRMLEGGQSVHSRFSINLRPEMEYETKRTEGLCWSFFDRENVPPKFETEPGSHDSY